MLNQFSNISCYEEFEIQCALNGISKIDALKEIGHQTDDYYFFISKDGIFNWFDLNGNHIENPGILKELKEEYIPLSISKCIIPNGVTIIKHGTFFDCNLLTSITIPNTVISIDNEALRYCDSLISITIPDNVANIGNLVFSFCKLLKEITIPDSITSIGYCAFFGCNSLKEVIFKGKTLDQIKQMKNYPFGIEDESIIKCEL